MSLVAYSDTEDFKMPLGHKYYNGITVVGGFPNGVYNAPGANSTSGYYNPDRAQQMAHHVDAGTSYTRKGIKFWNYPTLYLVSKDTRYRNLLWSLTRFQGTIDPLLSIPSSHSEVIKCDDIALKKIKGKLARSREEFRALLPLAEIRQTQSLLRDVLSASTNMVSSLIKLKEGRGSARDIRKRASELWLTFSFGVKPTLSDIESLATSISAYYNQTDFVSRYSAQHSVYWEEPYKFPQEYGTLTGYTLKYTQPTREINYKVRYSAGVHHDILKHGWNGTLENLNQHFGLRSEFLLPAFWEVVPFSWVVDYFTTAGDYFNDVVETPAADTFYLAKSTLLNARTWQDIDITFPASPYRTAFRTGSGGRQSIESFYYQRSMLTSLPTRSLRIKTVDEWGANGVNKVLNLASVLIGHGSKSTIQRRAIY